MAKQGAKQGGREKIQIYHNPRCSKSRAGLNFLREAGLEPEIIRYLDTPPDAQTLSDLLRKLNLSARDILRKREPAYKALDLGNESLDEKALIDAMVAHPKLIERPIVVKGDRAVLARPAEKIAELLRK